MKVSVNILNWNCLDILKQSIPQISNELQDYIHEIIIVDNGSDDGSAPWLFEKMEELRELKVIFNMTNTGISRGKNMGINKSQGEYLILLDCDVIPVPNSLKLMIGYLDKFEDVNALGMYPNKWSNQKNTDSIKYYETWCQTLFDVQPYRAACLYYGIYRRKLFDEGLRLNESGVFGRPGYGWEDHDFFMRLKKMGYEQHVAHVNHPAGKYYHAINSSIRNMGHDKYMESSRERGKAWNELWDRDSLTKR